jgi:UDP-glucose 4-epimerase
MEEAETRSVLITGAAGFLGRELARTFKRKGFKVVGIGNGALRPGEQSQLGLDVWREGVVSFDSLVELTKQAGRPHVVVHAAGGSSVQAALNSPSTDFRRTVSSTAELVEALRVLAPHTHLLMVSSAAVYGNDHSSAIDEAAPLAPISYYGAHKAMAEQLCLMASAHWGLRLDIVRLFSLYGAGLKKQIFWDLRGKLRSGHREIVLGGTGEETRDFLHVSDATGLLSHLVLNPPTDMPRILNGGTGTVTSIRSAAEMLVDACRSHVQLRFDGRRRPDNPDHLVADVRRAMSQSFVPRIGLAEGLSQYVEWCDRQQFDHPGVREPEQLVEQSR